MQIRPFPETDERTENLTRQQWFKQQRDSRFTKLIKDVSGNNTVNLTSDDASNHHITFQGALTGNINIVVPTTDWKWVIFNNTTGAFTLTVKTLSGTGIAVGQGKRATLLSDGTNVVRITADI